MESFSRTPFLLSDAALVCTELQTYDKVMKESPRVKYGDKMFKHNCGDKKDMRKNVPKNYRVHHHS